MPSQAGENNANWLISSPLSAARRLSLSQVSAV